MSELISVVIPVYNAEKTLQKCVDSIRNQIYQHLEMLLIDDGATDCSGKMCDEFAQMDERIVVIHVWNGGAGKARNIGVLESCGEYLAFLDSDDYADASLISDLLFELDLRQSDCVVSSIDDSIFEKNVTASFSDRFNLDIWIPLFEKSVLYAPWAKIYRTSIIKENHITFPTDLNYGEDMVFNIRHMRCIDTISYVNKNYYHYIRDNKESLSQKVRWNMFDNDMIFEIQLRDLFIEKGLYSGKIKEYDAYRILGVAYDSLFLLTRKDCPFQHTDIKHYISKILNHNLVKWSLTYVDTSKYAQWMVRPMKRRQAWKIQLLSFIKRKTP